MSTMREFRPVLLSFLSALLLATAALCSAAEPELIQRFGGDGDLRPTIGDGFMAEDFFERDLADAAASREYHTAIWRVPLEKRVLDRTRPIDGRDKGLRTDWRWVPTRADVVRLELEVERSEDRSEPELVDVTVSVRYEEGSRNYLVRLEGGERQVGLPLQHESLGSARSVTLLAFGPFHASVRWAALEQARHDVFPAVERLHVMAPEAAAQPLTSIQKSVDYCQSRNAYLKITNSGGYYVVAYGRRLPASSSTNVDYLLDVEYPAGSAFHVGTGGSQLAWDPPCKNYQTWTRRSDYSKAHIWQGMDDLMFRCSGIGTAICIQGCPEWEYFDVQLTGPSLGLCF